MNYSKGISWFDDCRIPFVEADSKINFDRPRTRESVNDEWVLKQAHDYTNPDYKEYNTQGRFPANLLVSDDMLNDGSISSKGKMKLHRMSGWGDNQNIQKDAVEYQGDKGSNSRYYDIDAWFDQLLEKLYLL